MGRESKAMKDTDTAEKVDRPLRSMHCCTDVVHPLSEALTLMPNIEFAWTPSLTASATATIWQRFGILVGSLTMTLRKANPSRDGPPERGLR